MMATQSNRLERVSTSKLESRLGSGLKNSALGPNAPFRASQPGPAGGALDAAEETNSSQSCTVLHAENASIAFGSPSRQSGHYSVSEIDFAELKDGTLVELVEDSRNSGQTCFAVWKDGEVRFVDRLEQDGQVFVPLSRKNEILGRLRLSSAARPYGSVQALLRGLESLISQCVSVDPKYAVVLADFVLSTWLVDRLGVAPYLSVVGLPQSGKTTLLSVLSLLCRRSLLIADITSPSFYQACAHFMPTILIDEAGSVDNNRTLRHILRSGTNRDVLAVRRNRIFHSYGAKVISWLEPPDDPALNSRCILIPMFESKSTALVRPDDPKVRQIAADLQAQLLRFRLENYKAVKPAAVAGDEVLRPRTRDLLRTLSAAHAQDAERTQGLLKFFESGQAVPAEPLRSEQNAVLRALFALIHPGKFHSVHIGDLTGNVNLFLQKVGERSLLPRKVGAVLTSLGFANKRRTNSGWVLYLSQQDAEKLHQLAACYGIDGFKDRFLGMSPEDCSLCRAAGLHKKGPDLPPVPPGYQVTTQAVNMRGKLTDS
jgi:hypothetical protein